MISILNETFTQKVFAGLSGLGGGLSGGHIVGAAQKVQQVDYEKMIARLKNNKNDEYTSIASQPWRIGLSSMLGMFPIIGSIFNVVNQVELDKLKEELKYYLTKEELSELSTIVNKSKSEQKISPTTVNKIKTFELKIADKNNGKVPSFTNHQKPNFQKKPNFPGKPTNQGQQR